MAELTCPRCHATVPAGALFCPNCQMSLNATSPVAALAPKSAEAADSGLRLVLPDHRSIPLPEGKRIEIGRESSNELIDDALADFLDVSRHHVAIERSGRTVRVTRTLAKSDNAIVAEGRPIESTGTLQVGERLRLGRNCWFKVVEE